jgi:hypothetical protein
VAENSFSFLKSLVEIKDTSARTNLVSHSVQGEFAYRNGPWKTVFKLPYENLTSSRGKPAMVEIYNLDEDTTEAHNLATEHPELIEQFTFELGSIVFRGTRRNGPLQQNDVNIRFDTIQTERWAPLITN